MIQHLPPFLQLVFGTALGAVFLLGVVGLQRVAAVIEPETVPFQMGPWLFGTVLLTGFSALEEWFFRGLLLSWILPLAGPAGAVAATSILFGLLHWPNTRSVLATFNAGLTGITFGLAVLQTGGLALAIGLHMGWNLFQWNVMGYSLYGKESEIGRIFPAPLRMRPVARPLLSGGPFGAEASLFTTLVWAASPLLILLVSR